MPARILPLKTIWLAIGLIALWCLCADLAMAQTDGKKNAPANEDVKTAPVVAEDKKSEEKKPDEKNIPDNKPLLIQENTDTAKDETPALLSDDVCRLPQPLCGDKPKFGSYWNSLSDSEHKIMLQGFDIGLTASWQTSYLEGEEAGNIRAGIFDRRLNIGETYAGSGIELFVDYFNKLYTDPANDSIDWSYAWMLASLAFQNEDVNNGGHDESFLKKFLQTYGELPGWVRIVDVKDVNLLEVEVLVPEPYRLPIRLRGVSVKNGDTALTEDQKQRGIKFIKGLAATRGYPFENCNCTEMVRPQLFYGSSLFTADGVLQAYVRVNENNFCLLKDEVKASDFHQNPPDTGFVLNEAILENGLAYMDEESSDYVESDKMMQNIDRARDKGFNIYGKARMPMIEKIIKQGAKPVNQNCVP